MAPARVARRRRRARRGDGARPHRRRGRTVAHAAQRLRGLARLHGPGPAGRSVPRPVARPAFDLAARRMAARRGRRLRDLRQRSPRRDRPVGGQRAGLHAAHRRERDSSPRTARRIASATCSGRWGSGTWSCPTGSRPRSTTRRSCPRPLHSRSRSLRSSTSATSRSTRPSRSTRTRRGYRSVHSSRRHQPDAAEGAAPVAPQPVLLDETGVVTFTGSLAAGTVVVADAATDRWTLRVNGSDVPRETVYGWASSYAVADPGAGSLSFDTPLARTLAIAGQAVVWLLAIVLLLRWKTSMRWPRGARAAVPTSAAPDTGIGRDRGARDVGSADVSVHRLPILLLFGGLLAAGLVIDQDPPPPDEVVFGTATTPGAAGRVAGHRGDVDVVLSWRSRAARRQRGRLRHDHEPHRGRAARAAHCRAERRQRRDTKPDARAPLRRPRSTSPRSLRLPTSPRRSTSKAAESWWSRAWRGARSATRARVRRQLRRAGTSPTA